MFQIEEGLAAVTNLPRVRAKGRYLFAGEDKFFIKGVTYGPFPENSRGEPLPEDDTVARDFELMRRAGVNAIRVYYVPPRHFLDIAARHGIRVNALCPGYVATDINQDFFATDAGKALIKRIPQRRLGRVEELDGPLLLLCFDAGSYMTGSVIAVDGGHLVSSL